MSMKTLTRLSYIDILKIVATFAIVLWHVSAVYVRMDAALLSPFGALPYVINLCVRFALPMFMMISGALLLRERYAFNFKQKFSYIIKLYAVWSLVYVIADQAMRAASGGALLSPAEMLASWIRGPYHFWYLQMLLGVYLLMPLLVRLKGLQTLNYATLLLFVIIYIYNPLSPYLPQAVNDVAGQVILMRPSTMLFFMLAGACLHRVPLLRKLAILSALAALAGFAIRLYLLFSTPDYASASTVQPLYSYSELLMTVGLFYLARYLCRSYEDGPRMQYLSKCTLRIYVSSALWISAYQFFIQPGWDALVPYQALSILVWSVVVFLCSWLTAHILVKKDRALARRKRQRAS